LFAYKPTRFLTQVPHKLKDGCRTVKERFLSLFLVISQKPIPTIILSDTFETYLNKKLKNSLALFSDDHPINANIIRFGKVDLCLLSEGKNQTVE
jgi:hypothetical protein